MGDAEPADNSLILRAKNIELAAYQAYLESVFQSVSDSLIVAGPDWTMRMVNRGTLELLGYVKEELIGRPAGLLSPGGESFSPDQADRLLHGEPIRSRDAVYRTKRGESIPVSLSLSLMRDKAGSPIGMVGIAKDMREIRHFQAEERRLQEMVKERTAQLERSMQDLLRAQAQLVQSEKLSAVGRLAAGVAHEINNPLGVILGFAEGVARRVGQENPLSMPLRSIEREALRCKRLVQDLLLFSRQRSPDATPFDLNEAAGSALALVKAQSRLEKVELVYEPHPCGRIRGDQNQIQQALINLCTNAIDAMPNGGKLAVRTSGRERDGRSWVLLEVEDNGVGIPESNRDKIFEPFFTTKGPGKGTGLGLALVHECVLKHHGTIEVISEVGKGSTFRIELPEEVS